MFPELGWYTPEVLQSHSDACPRGYGLIFGNNWVYGTFPKNWGQSTICFLEAYPIMLMFNMFTEHLANRRILIRTDNMSLVQMLNDSTSRHKNTMAIIRNIVLKAMEHNIVYRVVHIEGKSNVLSDHLSRLRLQEFHSEAKRMSQNFRQEPTEVPTHLLPKNFKIT